MKVAGLSHIFIPNDFWHGRRTVGRHFIHGEIGGYYNDLTAKAMPYSGAASAEGVPLVNAGRRYGLVLHPVTVCQVALGWHEQWLDRGGESCLHRFLALADWLVANQRSCGCVAGVWPIPYPVPLHNLPAGWISALVQGQAVSTLVRAHKVTGKDYYLSTAERALQCFGVDVAQGGVRTHDSQGRVFFEEYPTTPSSHVLNGFVSALWGLYDYAVWAHDRAIESLFADGLEALAASLPLYDTGYWSRYMLVRYTGFSNLASPYYHQEHIAQLRATYLLTANEVFRDTANRWEDYQRSWTSLARVITVKSLSRICLRIRYPDG